MMQSLPIVTWLPTTAPGAMIVLSPMSAESLIAFTAGVYGLKWRTIVRYASKGCSVTSNVLCSGKSATLLIIMQVAGELMHLA